MHAIFIADAHLRRKDDENYRLLLEFLAGLRGSIDILYILGDLFEFWIGYERTPYPHYLPVLEKLQELRESGIEIVYFEGNHDFHLGPDFTGRLGVRVYPGPATVVLDGRRVHLCHGDEVNRRDYPYRLLRSVLHGRLIRALTRVVPPAVAAEIAERMGRKSKQNHQRRQHKWDYAALLRAYAAERFAEGCDVVISGHFHLPLIEGDSGHTLLCLGDWLTHYTYGEWRDGVLTLRSYREECRAGDSSNSAR